MGDKSKDSTIDIIDQENEYKIWLSYAQMDWVKRIIAER